MFFVSALVAAAVLTAVHCDAQQTPAQSWGSGESIAFGYANSNWCHGGYTPITVWLSESVPTSLNSSGELPEGTYIEYYGQFLIPNFGLPPLPPTAPATITIPDISSYSSGSDLYVSVVETANTCPPGNQPPQYEYSTVAVTVE
ncbi:hypothetical protein B0H10DRAFT_2198706 [Mycena sp. CBHHK59/15]|nr:hypothetical protein B0H10DRAFT_2198706 [Mycena sp. CBHHK59/15]